MVFDDVKNAEAFVIAVKKMCDATSLVDVRVDSGVNPYDLQIAKDLNVLSKAVGSIGGLEEKPISEVVLNDISRTFFERLSDVVPDAIDSGVISNQEGFLIMRAIVVILKTPKEEDCATASETGPLDEGSAAWTVSVLAEAISDPRIIETLRSIHYVSFVQTFSNQLIRMGEIAERKQSPDFKFSERSFLLFLDDIDTGFLESVLVEIIPMIVKWNVLEPKAINYIVSNIYRFIAFNREDVIGENEVVAVIDLLRQVLNDKRMKRDKRFLIREWKETYDVIIRYDSSLFDRKFIHNLDSDFVLYLSTKFCYNAERLGVLSEGAAKFFRQRITRLYRNLPKVPPTKSENDRMRVLIQMMR